MVTFLGIIGASTPLPPPPPHPPHTHKVHAFHCCHFCHPRPKLKSSPNLLSLQETMSKVYYHIIGTKWTLWSWTALGQALVLRYWVNLQIKSQEIDQEALVKFWVIIKFAVWTPQSFEYLLSCSPFDRHPPPVHTFINWLRYFDLIYRYRRRDNSWVKKRRKTARLSTSWHE